MNAIILGQSTVMAEILATFCKNVYICIDKSFSSRHLKELEYYNILQSKNSVKTIKGVIPKAKEIKRWIKDYDLSIIFSQTKYDMLAAKLASMTTRKKVILLGTSHSSYAWVNKKNVKLMSILIRCTTDCYVALASFVYNKLREFGLKEKNLVLLPNTVEHSAWKVKTDYSVNRSFRVAYIAFVHPMKRQHLLVDIAKRTKEHDVIFDCYGNTNLADEYAKKINKDILSAGLDGKVNLKGRIENSELRDILKDYDAYICPSYLEMSPVNILEAQAAGLPVLASNIGGIPDMVKDNETGLLFERDNVADAAEKIELLINDKRLREKLGKAGRKYVSSSYTSKEASLRIKTKIFEFIK